MSAGKVEIKDGDIERWIEATSEDDSWQLTAFEEIRDGLVQAHLRAAEHGDKVLMACMRAHHSEVNRSITKLGGESVDLADLESIAVSGRSDLEQTPQAHSTFSVWDIAWMMRCNSPVQVRVVKKIEKGFSRKGWAGWKKDREILTDYEVSEELHRYDHSSGVKVDAGKLFRTKEELINFLASAE